jgi:hypothetical protein
MTFTDAELLRPTEALFRVNAALHTARIELTGKLRNKRAAFGDFRGTVSGVDTDKATVTIRSEDGKERVFSLTPARLAQLFGDEATRRK